MLNTKLFKLLGGLSPKEMGKLRIYLAQRHKPNVKTFLLFEYINKYHPDLKKHEKKLTEIKIYDALFEATKFSKNRLQELTSRLLKNVEAFLVNLEVEEDHTLRDILLSKALKKRGIDDLFTQYNERAQKGIFKAEICEQTHYDALFRLSYDAVFHRNTVTLHTQYHQQLIELEKHLDLYYALHKAKISCQYITLSTILDIEPHKPLIDIDLNSISTQMPDEYLIGLYAKFTLMYQRRDLQIYHQLKTIVTDNTKPISPPNRYHLIVLLINFCSREYKQRDPMYLKEIFDLFEFSNNTNLFIVDGFMSEISYLNLIKIAVATKQFDHAEKWLSHAKYMKPAHQENGHKLASAILLFAKGDYAEIPALLHQKVVWRNINYKLTARSILAKTYYEIADYEQLRKHLESSRKALKRDSTLSKDHEIVNINFLKMVNQLAKHKEKSTSPDEALLSTLHNSPMVYREWCGKKIEELKVQTHALQADDYLP